MHQNRKMNSFLETKQVNRWNVEKPQSSLLSPGSCGVVYSAPCGDCNQKYVDET